MAMLLAFTVLFLATTISAAPVQSSWEDTNVVITKTGIYMGIVDGATPNVRQFRHIAFALPPIGERRWLPPVPMSSGVETKYDSTRFPPSCPQYAPYVRDPQNCISFRVFKSLLLPEIYLGR